MTVVTVVVDAATVTGAISACETKVIDMYRRLTTNSETPDVPTAPN